MERGHGIAELSVGMSAEVARAVTDDDIAGFATVTGDRNPVHLDEEYAAKTLFKGRIAHGMLSAGFISAVIGMELPGPGAIYMSQSLFFRAPVRPGDTVVTRVTVKEVVAEKRRVKLDTVCRVGDTVVLDGEALVMVPA